jgi:hypothetical protein
VTNPPGPLGALARAVRATLLVAVLLLGATLHFWHHVQDPDCGSGREGATHVCVACAGLHASSLVAQAQAAPAPVCTEWRDDAPPAVHAPDAAAPPHAAPRAPPSA